MISLASPRPPPSQNHSSSRCSRWNHQSTGNVPVCAFERRFRCPNSQSRYPNTASIRPAGPVSQSMAVTISKVHGTAIHRSVTAKKSMRLLLLTSNESNFDNSLNRICVPSLCVSRAWLRMVCLERPWSQIQFSINEMRYPVSSQSRCSRNQCFQELLTSSGIGQQL
jgi:hypothetical protein